MGNTRRLFLRLKSAKLPFKVQNKSLYLVIGLCIIAIIATGVWAVKSSPEKGPDKTDKNVSFLKEQIGAVEQEKLEQKEIEKKQTSKEEDGLKQADKQASQEAAMEETGFKTAAESQIEESSTQRPSAQKKNQEGVNAESQPVLKVNLNTMVQPVLGKVIVDYAVDRLVYSNTLEQWQTHPGIDIAADEGTPVKAVLPGTIVDVTCDPRLGNLIVIEHGDGIKTKYGNLLSAGLVEKGEYVNKGDVIGAVGRSARFESADPPHLHFEIEQDGKPVDPHNYLPKIE